MNKIKVLLGLSGGVDSAVALYLLKEQGYDVEACFMRNWDSLLNNDQLGNPTVDDDICPQEKDYLDAKAVADKLGVKLYRKDFVKEYWDDVFTNLIYEYEHGRTPNPDVLCNKYIKFSAFLDYANSLGFDYIAMGHYAKKIIEDDKSYLVKPKDRNKDQTYFLARLNRKQLDKAIFPLSDISKEEVREIALKLGLNVANKKDSTGICFIGERHFREFLSNYIPMKKGDIIEIDTNRKIGEHQGVFYYTIGQRKGLGIGGIKDIKSHGWFIVKKDVRNNILYVANGDEDKHLYSDEVIVEDINLLAPELLDENKTYQVQFRYRAKDVLCHVKLQDDKVIIYALEEKFKAVAPGQLACVYTLDDRVLLSGTIALSKREGHILS